MRRAVFIDALGTMLWLQPPWENVPAPIADEVGAERLRDAFIAEITYYREHIDEGRDASSLAELRSRCAEVLSREAGRRFTVEEMMAAIRFSPFPETAGALTELRELGLKLVCVSNWDCSLPDVLDGLGLAALLDGVVTSASSGTSKPDPGIFEPALRIAACEPGDAVHVGDTEDDLRAADAAGIPRLLIDRSGGGDIASLSEIRQHLGG